MLPLTTIRSTIIICTREPDMGFVKDAARIGTFGLAGALLSKKKKPPTQGPQPFLTLSNQPPPQTQQRSLLGPRR